MVGAKMGLSYSIREMIDRQTEIITKKQHADSVERMQKGAQHVIAEVAGHQKRLCIVADFQLRRYRVPLV